MTLIIDKESGPRKGWVRLSDGKQIRIVKDAEEGSGRKWVYARDVFKILGAPPQRYYPILADLDPSDRGAIHPFYCPEETWMNLVSFGALPQLVCKINNANPMSTGIFLGQFMRALKMPFATLWEQSLFEEDADANGRTAGE